MSDLLKLLKERYSCRGYLPRVPEKEKILQAVEAASYAASSKNTQPWKLHVATGPACDKVREALCAAFDGGAKPGADFKYSPDEMPPEWVARGREIGFALFAHKGIGRDDKEARRAHDRENFRLFGASAVAVLTVPRSAERGNYLDAGQFLGSLILALRAVGMESVPMFSVANYPSALRATLPIPDDRAVVCALAFGYADPAAHVNAFRTGREKPEDLVSWA